MNDIINGEATLTKAVAAAVIGTSPRSVSRLIEKGELTELSDGNVLRAEVLAHLENQARTKQTIELASMNILKETNNQYRQQNTDFAKLFTGPIAANSKANDRLVKRMMKRAAKVEKLNLKMMGVIGDILMQKQEREDSQRLAEARAQAIKEAGGTLKEVFPVLSAQLFGKKKAKALKVLKNLKQFATDLDEEQRAALLMLADAFEGKQGKRLKEALTFIGVKATAEAIEEEQQAAAEEEAQEGSSEAQETAEEDKPPETQRNAETTEEEPHGDEEAQ